MRKIDFRSLGPRLLVPLFVCAMAQQAAAVEAPSLPWIADYNQAVEDSRATSRPLLIDFEAEWCHWCKVMEQEVYADPAVVQKLEAFSLLKVDVDRNPKLALEFQIQSLPRTLIINTHGQIVGDHLGYIEPERFLRALDDALERKETFVDGLAAVPPVGGEDAASPEAVSSSSGSFPLTPWALVQYLYVGLGHPDPDLRDQIVKMLVDGDPRTRPLILGGLASRRLGRRIAAFEALKQIAPGSASAFNPWETTANRRRALVDVRSILESAPAAGDGPR